MRVLNFLSQVQEVLVPRSRGLLTIILAPLHRAGFECTKQIFPYKKQ